jgi:hypothetical protein
MKHSKIVMAAFAIVLAVSSAFVSKASHSKTVLTDLYTKDANNNCVKFTCISVASISCDQYFLNPTDCANSNNPQSTTLKHN